MAVQLNRTRKASAGQESSHDLQADTLAELLALDADRLHALGLEPGALAFVVDEKALYCLTELAASGATPGTWKASSSSPSVGQVTSPNFIDPVDPALATAGVDIHHPHTQICSCRHSA